MQPLIWEHRPDGLRAPALICAFTGWNDAGDAASSALSFLGASLGATRFAQVDPEDYYDFQTVRPKVRLVEGETREIVWPAVEIFVARVPRAPRNRIVAARRDHRPAGLLLARSRAHLRVIRGHESDSVLLRRRRVVRRLPLDGLGTEVRSAPGTQVGGMQAATRR